MRVSWDVVFDESASWYLPPSSPTLVHSEQNPEDEAEIANSFEEDISTQDCPISFRLNGPIEESSQDGRSASKEESNTLFSPKKMSKKRLQRRDKEK